MTKVEITWEDSQASMEGWLHREDFAEWADRPALEIKTIGYVYEETDTAFVLVQSYSPKQVIHGIKIPKRCITNIDDLLRDEDV